MRTKESLPLLTFTDIMLGDSTGPRCARCGGSGAETPRDTGAVLDDIAAAVKGWGEGAGPNLRLTGIEPYNHPEIVRIVRAASAAGAKRLELDTNASALAARETALTALEGGVRHLRFTLLGPTADAHDMLVGTPGRFEATLRGVRGFAGTAGNEDATVRVSAHVVLCRHNLQHVLETVVTAARAGASSVLIAVADPHLDLGSAAPWIEAACDTGIVNSVWVEVEGVPFCAVSGWELHLASVYRRVKGSKAPACAACPLAERCGGVVCGASERTLTTLCPPATADALAEKLERGFRSPERADG